MQRQDEVQEAGTPQDYHQNSQGFVQSIVHRSSAGNQRRDMQTVFMTRANDGDNLAFTIYV